ncbi:MAG: hypothetical protein J0M20_11555 [Burkholderiales bacterium]|nr:hypothetical protein [Burkholderiales bacterium]
MPQTYYLGGRTPLVTWTACLLWALASLLAAWVGWWGSTAAAWWIATAGVVATLFAVTGGGLWWRLEWARRAGVVCLLAVGVGSVGLVWLMAGQALWALLAALPVSVALAWLARRLDSTAVREQFVA